MGYILKNFARNLDIYNIVLISGILLSEASGQADVFTCMLLFVIGLPVGVLVSLLYCLR